MWEIKDGWKMLRRQYRIDTLDTFKILRRYGDILSRRKRLIDEKKAARLMKTIETFNRLVEEVNY